jgi:hypothetical protein
VDWISHNKDSHEMPTSSIEEIDNYQRRIVQWYDNHLKGDLKKKAGEKTVSGQN